MLKLFSHLIFRESRAFWTLFFTIAITAFAFLSLMQLGANIEREVTKETRPLFGAEVRVSPQGYMTGEIIETIRPYLSDVSYTWAERREFSTTLFDREGKTGLVRVVAHDGEYPQRGVLKTEKIDHSEERGICPGNTERVEQILHASGGQEKQKLGNTGLLRTSQGQNQTGKNRVAVMPGTIDRFASGGSITLDGRELGITEKILESSDLGFSFGTENHLIILPRSVLSGSLLLSSGSRLDHDLLLSFEDEKSTKMVRELLEKSLNPDLYRVRSYQDRTEMSLDTVAELANYLLLILLVSSIFAVVILRSAHDTIEDRLARTLRIAEILGLSRRRQYGLYGLLYLLIVPTALVLATISVYILLSYVRGYEIASGFEFLVAPLAQGSLLIVTILLIAWSPSWIARSTFFDKYKKYYIEHFLILLLVFFLLFFIFGDFLQSVIILAVGLTVFLVFFVFVRWLYRRLRTYALRLRKKRFPLYDGIRMLSNPSVPSTAITLSLIFVTVFFIVFGSFSLAFRAKLTLDSESTANIYAVNILESDRESIKPFTASGEIYDILRARIISINDKTLEKHFDVERASGEFTREFNITTTPLENKIIRGASIITKDEVSVDDEFASRLGVDIGDRITFLLSGRQITLTVASIRESRREGFQPFFYFSFEPIAFAKAPKTYFISASVGDTEAWKASLLGATGPHVTFIDVEYILSIVRDVSSKVLTVISVFLLVVSLFALFAIVSFFARLTPLESQKSRLYSLFGSAPVDTERSLSVTRYMIFAMGYILSVIIGVVAAYIIIGMGDFLEWSWTSSLLIVCSLLGVYATLGLFLSPKRSL